MHCQLVYFSERQKIALLFTVLDDVRQPDAYQTEGSFRIRRHFLAHQGLNSPIEDLWTPGWGGEPLVAGETDEISVFEFQDGGASRDGGFLHPRSDPFTQGPENVQNVFHIGDIHGQGGFSGYALGLPLRRH